MVRTFQLMRPFYSMSVLDNVSIAVLAGTGSRRSAREEAATIIETVGLTAWRDSPTEGLPTAALKRLELARTLALRPKVLLLDEVLAVEHALHYQLSNLDALMQERYPGTRYAPPTVWWEDYQQWANTSLATLRGTLDTVHEQLRVEQRLREEQVLADLAAKTANAAGNLDVTQTGNMITAQVVEELRKTRQMLGALINADNVAHAHAINREAVSERLEQVGQDEG